VLQSVQQAVSVELLLPEMLQILQVPSTAAKLDTNQIYLDLLNNLTVSCASSESIAHQALPLRILQCVPLGTTALLNLSILIQSLVLHLQTELVPWVPTAPLEASFLVAALQASMEHQVLPYEQVEMILAQLALLDDTAIATG
jgi:hypothetical protein